MSTITPELNGNASTGDVTPVNEGNTDGNTTVPTVEATPTVNPHVAAVNAYVAEGMSMTEAIGKRVEESGSPRATVYGAMRRAGLTGNVTPKTPVDPIEAARALLEGALANVDNEVTALKVASEDAVAAYKTARDGAKARKDDLKARIAALTVAA